MSPWRVSRSDAVTTAAIQKSRLKGADGRVRPPHYRQTNIEVNGRLRGTHLSCEPSPGGKCCFGTSHALPVHDVAFGLRSGLISRDPSLRSAHSSNRTCHQIEARCKYDDR